MIRIIYSFLRFFLRIPFLICTPINAQIQLRLLETLIIAIEKNDFWYNFIQNNKKLIDSALADVAVKNDIAVQALTKKIKYAYLLTGGSLGLALIELVVIFLKVM